LVRTVSWKVQFPTAAPTHSLSPSRNIMSGSTKHADAMAPRQAAGGRACSCSTTPSSRLADHNQLIRGVWKDPKPGPAEKRHLIDQLYFSMIEIGQYAKKAMEEVDET
jgi:hypothetical protein